MISDGFLEYHPYELRVNKARESIELKILKPTKQHFRKFNYVPKECVGLIFKKWIKGALD